MSKPASVELADFVLGSSYSGIPEEVVRNVKFHVINVVGLCLASGELEAGRVVAKVAAQMGGEKEATIVGRGGLFPAPNAALANGTMAHVLDYDDTHDESFIHVGPPVVPAALAMGQREKVDGKELLTAIAIGMETAIRVGLASPGQLTKVGFHPTSVCGVFGATAAAGKILRLSRDRMANAFGIAGSQASGLYEFFSDGSWVKQFHPGWAAHSGVIAALLAEGGMTGPKTVLEGRFGVYRTHLGGAAFSTRRVLKNLGGTWELSKTAFKPWPCGVVLHPFLRCAEMILSENRIDPRDVEEVACLVPAGMVPLVLEPLDQKVTPKTPYDGKFSLPFAISAMVVDGKVDTATFSDAKIKDRSILRLAKRVRYESDSKADYPRTIPARVSVKLRNGKEFVAHTETNPGGPEAPMTREEHFAKFMSNASPRLGEQKARRLLLELDDLENADSIGRIMRLCG